MTGLDWIIIAVMLLSVVLAASQGFFSEVISLAGLVLGYLLAVWEYPRVAPWFAPYVKAQWVADIAAFLAIFILVAILAGIAARVAHWIMKESGLRWFDRVLGGAFGLLRGVFIAIVLVMALAAFAPGSRWLAGSGFAPYLLAFGRAAVWVAPSDVRQRFRDGVKAIHEVKDARTLPAIAQPKEGKD